jgi:hypothetical protein
VVAILFEIAGLAAIFGSVGLVFAITMSVLQEVWIVVAAVGLAVRSRTRGPDAAPVRDVAATQ